MFGKVIYYDKAKVEDYTAIITGKAVAEIKSIQKTTNKEAGVDFPLISAGIGGSATYELEAKESILHNISEFEKLLKDREDYFDFTVGDDFALETIPRGQIVKFNSSVYIPEAFDVIQMIEQFKPTIMNRATVDMENDEADAFQVFFNTQNAKIPILSNLDDAEVCSLIESSCLKIPYEGLEEYEEQEVSILARTLDASLVSKDKAFFEPLKHFIKLNRTIRKTMTTNVPSELSPIYSDADYRQFEIIAIYD